MKFKVISVILFLIISGNYTHILFYVSMLKVNNFFKKKNHNKKSQTERKRHLESNLVNLRAKYTSLKYFHTYLLQGRPNLCNSFAQEDNNSRF